MKMRKMSTTVLAAVIATTLVGGSSAFAEAGSLGSTGKVTVEEGKAGGEDQGTLDPENPDKEKPLVPDDEKDETTNPDTGALVLEKTSNLNFGTIKTGSTQIKQPAAAISATVDGAKVSRGAYVQWADVRAGNANGYTITAELSKQFTSGSSTLDGATISFTNGGLKNEIGNENTKPTASASMFELNVDQAVTVVTAKKAEGKGRYVMGFGNSTDGTEGNSVFLNVPSTTAANMVKGDYTAAITWKIIAAE